MREWLRGYRDNKNMSQTEVAVIVRITPQHYSYIENGDRRPSPEVAKRIAEVIGFTDEWYKLLESSDRYRG